MLFNSLRFLEFFVVVYAAYLALPRWRYQNALLLAASYVFYASWNWMCLGLILSSTIVDYFCGLAMYRSQSRARKRSLLLVSVSFNLLLLGIFKYYGFFTDSFERLLNSLGMNVGSLYVDIILPVGISFYTFQTLSYTIDIYRGELKPTRDLLNFSLFVAYFPQLVAGPIERAKVLLPQIESERRLDQRTLATGCWLIFWGLWKKVVVADRLALSVDSLFETTVDNTLIASYLAVVAFAFQIYCDFSGYSDIARGVSKLFGIELMLNFNLPYVATNPSDFWRRWHISLSTWLRDYLYIPLGGNRQGNVYCNLMITMVLGGLWHGASWNFVWWGVYHGVLLAIHRFVSAFKSINLHWLVRWLAMFHATLFGWLLFRCTRRVEIDGRLRDDSWNQMIEVLTSLANGVGLDETSWLLLCEIALTIAPLLVIQYFQFRSKNLLIVLDCSLLARICCYSFLLATLLLMGIQSGGAFIYFQF